MITNLDKQENRMAIIEGLVMRGAPRLMRIGGGGLSRETHGCEQRPKLTDEQRAKAFEMAATGKFHATAIARAIGSTQSMVFYALKKQGIRAKNGLWK